MTNVVEDQDGSMFVDMTPKSTAQPISETPVVENTEEFKQTRVVIDQEVSSKSTDEKVQAYSLPSVSTEELKDLNNRLKGYNFDSSADAKKWAASLNGGVDYYTVDGMFTNTLCNPNAVFKQYIETEDKKIAITPISLKARSDSVISGDYARLLVLKKLNLGEIVNVPLVHSGLNLAIRPPTDRELINFYQTLSAQKISLGRSTGGYIYSNFTAFYVSALIDLIMDNIFSVNVASEQLPVAKLKETISVNDLFTLVWGLACSMHPKGFEYERPCLSDPGECTYVARGRLNLTKLLVTDNNALSANQKKHMSFRQANSRTLAQVTEYQAEHAHHLHNTKIIDDITFKFKVPTIAAYLNAGDRWVASIENELDKHIFDKESDKEEALNKFALSSVMRHYRHWIESIEIEGNRIEDEDTIDKLLEEFSSVDIIREGFHKAVVEFIEKTTISVVGIPVYNCPDCGKSQSTAGTDTSFVNYIPLDVLQLFFDLIIRRMQSLARRTLS